MMIEAMVFKGVEMVVKELYCLHLNHYTCIFYTVGAIILKEANFSSILTLGAYFLRYNYCFSGFV